MSTHGGARGARGVHIILWNGEHCQYANDHGFNNVFQYIYNKHMTY